jgi:hypothetical protein
MIGPGPSSVLFPAGPFQVKSIVSFDIQAAGTNGPFAGLRVIAISLMVFVEDFERTEAAVVLFQEMPEVSSIL